MRVHYICTTGHEAAQGRQHRDPGKETGVPQAFEDQADISPEFCTAVKDINRGLRMFMKKSTDNLVIKKRISIFRHKSKAMKCVIVFLLAL